MHDLPLIPTIAAAFTAAWLLGLLTQRLKLSPIVGYILAGILIGPHTPGYIGDVGIAQQLAEVGVILLMFGVGLHFRLKDLLAVRSVAIPGAIVQSLVATAAAVFVFKAFDIPPRTGAVIGMAMAVASTVVLMRVLMDAGTLSSPQGHVAVGWLIVEDIFTVLLLVLIPALGASGAAEAAGTTKAPALWMELGKALLALAGLIVLVLFGGGRVVPWVLVRVAKLRSRELFTLTVLVFSIAIAAGSFYVFGASMALGAFLAGMVVAQSPVSHQAAADALPLRDAFAVLFFVSVGMLFDPGILVREPLLVLAGLGIILVAKPLAALVIVAVLGHPATTALTVAIGLAQIGEFSFILSDLARRHGLMPETGHNLLVASAILSISLNPLLFRALPRIEAWLRRHRILWLLLNGLAERRARATNRAAAAAANARAPGQRLAVVVGYGPVGRSVHGLLRDAGLETSIIDMNMNTVSALTARGETAFFGDASHSSILEQAGLRRATHLILTVPDSAARAAILAAARALNPAARVLVRARYLEEREDLERAGASAAVFEEEEAAVGLARLVLADSGVHREAAERKVRDLRLQLVTENMANIGSQRVRSVMVPWTRVRRLLASSTRAEVFALIAQERFSRWPVVEPQSARVTGYLLTKDLIADASGDDWTRLVRPLRSIGPGDDVGSTLARMQHESATVYVVEDAERPVGFITLEDILEQVVGRIEDEYPREDEVSLRDALERGRVVLDLAGTSREEVIRELAESIPGAALPAGMDQAEILRLALEREAEVATDLGVGAAIPHARCPRLEQPLVVFGRSRAGIRFSAEASQPVRLVFLLVTPLEQPEIQLTLLGKLAALAGDQAVRERLLRASWPAEMLEILGETVDRGVRAS